MRRTSFGPSFSPEARGFRFSGALVAALILAAGVLAGCAVGGIATGAPSGSAATASPAASPTAQPSPSAFPLTVVDDEGTSVSIPARPKLVVSLTAATTEIAFALGGGEQVVATDSASDHPDAAASLPHVADFGAVDIEKIVGLHADLVLAGGNGYTPPDAIAKLRSLGMAVVVVYAPTVEEALADVELVGRAIGRADEGVALFGSMKHEIDALAAAVRDLPKPRVFYEIDATSDIYGPADDSFLAQMVGLAGGTAVTSGSPDNFQIPLERLIAADPEVIVLGDAAFGATIDVVRSRPGWAVITAVKAGAIRAVDDKVITRPGPRLATGLRSLILAIHPDAHLP